MNVNLSLDSKQLLILYLSNLRSCLPLLLMLIRPLTSLRFVFAFMVFCSHLVLLEQSDNEINRWLFKAIFYEGYIGVTFFFVLSGFILAYVYQEKLSSKRISVRKFYLARWARIYPLHILTLIIAIPLEFWNLKIESEQIIAGVFQLFLSHSIVPFEDVYFSFNGPSWSISTEAYFYLCFPVIMLIIFKSKRWLKVMLFSMLLLAVPFFMNVLPDEWLHYSFYIFPLGRIADFILGIGLYQVLKKFPMNFLKARFMETMSLLLFAGFFMAHHWIEDIYRYSVYYWIPIVAIIAVFYQQKGYLSKLLSTRTALWLGEISFSFYMFSHLVYRYIVWGNDTYKMVDNNWVLIAIILIISLLMAALSYTYFEVPSNRWLRKKFAS